MVVLTTIFRKKLREYHKVMQEKDGDVRVFLHKHLHNLMIIECKFWLNGAEFPA